MERRKFFRHPTSVPIECRVDGHGDYAPHEVRDVSHGGIAFVSDRPYELGDIVELRYPTLTHPETVRGMIVWTVAADGGASPTHINGLSFSDPSARYHGRIVEQICHIEDYRIEQRKQQARDLTHGEAAAEWIAANAADFPD
ncbi:MAG: PilZ domain-containing protein [Verrucomicrobia bacterium]|jgi:hypothetical protein|nr:PilZ domain-containing protein [Verrucomicrobiota bacterium]